MTWLAAVPWLLPAAALLYLPGFALLLPARLPLLARLAAAPALGLLFLMASAAAAAWMGVPWGWPWGWPWLALASVPALAAPYFRRRRLRPPTPAPELATARAANRVGAASPDGAASAAGAANRAGAGHYLLGIGIAAVVIGPAVLAALGSPEFFAQRYDNVFHLNAIHLAATTGAASPTSFDLIGATGFYPPGWYAWVSLLMQLTGLEIAVAVQLATLVTVFALWPLALAWLVETWLRPGIFGRLAVGPLALASVSFPFALLDWGTLYPNLLGLALAPAVVAAGLVALGKPGRSASKFAAPADPTDPAEFGPSAVVPAAPGTMSLLFLATFSAAFFAHPNAALAAAIFLIPVAFAALLALRGFARGMVVAGLATFPVFWMLASDQLVDTQREPFLSIPHAVGEVFLGTSLGKPVVWILAIGLWVGLALTVRARRWLLIAPLVLFGVMYVGVTTFSNDQLTSLLAGPFYNDPYRVGALLALPTLPLAVAGWDAIARAAARFARTHLPAPAHPQAHPAAPAHIRARTHTRADTPSQVTGTTHTWRTLGVAAVGAALLAATVLPSAGWRDTAARLQETFHLTESSDVLTVDELALIQRIPQHVPEGAVVVANPWHGGSLVFAFADRPVTQFYMTQRPSEHVELINTSLNEAATNPAVCAALTAVGANYAIELEDHNLRAVRPAPENPGLRNLDSAAGFELLDSEGDTALYRITACRASAPAPKP